MPPDIMSSYLVSPSSSKRPSFICCDHCGFKMTKILPPESSRQTPVGKLSIATMLFGDFAQIAMIWLKKWLRLWQSFSATLMKTVLMGIAKGAYRVALAAATPLKKEEVIQRNDETRHLKDGHLEHLILSSFESLVEDGHLGRSPRLLLNGSNDTKMKMIQMSEQYLINSSISFDLGSNWEGSLEEGIGLDNRENPEKFSQKWLEDCYNPHIFTKSLDIGEYFGEKLEDSHTHFRKIMEVEGSFCQVLGSPSVSWEPKEGLELSGNFVMEEHNSDHSTDLPVCGRKDEDSLKLGAPITSDFKSPLVLSLFYSPSEDEDDDEDDSEEWWSEDEKQESCQSQTSLDGGDLGKEAKSLDVDDHPLHQDVLERLSDPIFQKNDPFCLTCSSKPTQILGTPAIASSEPKPHKEIIGSHYLTKMDSKPETWCDSPKHSQPPAVSRSVCRCWAHECNRSSSGKKCDPIITEVPSVSQEPNQIIKKVRFSPVVTIHPLIVWDYASRAARRGPWEEMARDRSRFSRRISEVGALLERCLEKEHRAKIWRKIHLD